MSDNENANEPAPARDEPTGDQHPQNHKVGRGFPPREFQFPKGRSGNPGGKRKVPPAPDPKAMLSRALCRTVQYTESGKTRSAPALEVAFLALSNRAARGDPQAVREIQRLMKEFGLTITSEPERTPIDYGAQVRAKIEEMAGRIEASKTRESGSRSE